MPLDNTPTKKKYPLGFYILPGILVANILLMFGLIWLAEVHHPEVVEPHYYTAGSIDSVKRNMRENRDCGWFPVVHYEHTAGAGRLIVTVRDSSHQFVYGLNVNAGLYRPSSDLLDRSTQTLLLSDSDKYVSTIQPPLQHGLWNVLLTIASIDGKHFHDRFAIQVE